MRIADDIMQVECNSDAILHIPMIKLMSMMYFLTKPLGK